MRIILDENLPISLAGSFTGHEVVHVEQLGWKSIKNGDLLRRISGQYDAFLTGDTNLQYQQNLGQFDVAVVLIRTPRNLLPEFIALVPEVLAALQTARAGVLTVVGGQ